jgi:hypothetical protein
MNKIQSSFKLSSSEFELNFDKTYWENRWQNNEIGWDIGHPSPAITDYLDQYENKNASILIPGCGNAYEAEYLIKKGFSNITLIDISPKAVEKLKEKFITIPEVKILCTDFFTHQARYDLVIEQTFFCAILPSKRTDYVNHASELLNDNAKIIGVLFNKEFNQPNPPFGGSIIDYKNLFEPFFTIKKMEECYNSILPRKNSEVFINFIKKMT